MPSLIPGFEYDIFISYRHNDNLDGWVTHFARDLEQELKGTLKNPVSIYFDQNAHDGLLDSHSVDKSLEGKVRSFILIPVVSQTYCDQKSFAWQHELCAFTRFLKEDALGKDVRLANGNVASRILPVKIHDLDPDDKILLETELGGALRAIEFIYKEPGVNRPLKSTDSKLDNQYKTDYRNQVNKVANAVKDLLAGIIHGHQTAQPLALTSTHSNKSAWRKRAAIAAALILVISLGAYGLYNFGGSLLSPPTTDRSIAVLPFENMSKDPEQDYFSSGITEDILNQLVKIADLKVKSRTSTLQYKGTQKSMIEIGQELSVRNIVEGSVRRVGDKVRVVVQLIDTETDVHIWSETYDRQLEDVLSLQSEIAIEIANALKAQLSTSEKLNIAKEASNSAIAYDYYLRARGVFDWTNFTKSNAQSAFMLVDEAIRLDPDFSRAYAFKGLCWYYQRYFGVSQKVWVDSAIVYSSRAIAIDPNSPDGYLVQARVHETMGNVSEAGRVIDVAYRLAPNDPDAIDAKGYSMIREMDQRGAELVLRALQSKYSVSDPRYWIWLGDIYRDMGVDSASEKLYKKAKTTDPALMDPYLRLATLYLFRHDLEKGLVEAALAEKISPADPAVINAIARLYFTKKDFGSAASYWSRYQEIEATFTDKTQFLPWRLSLGLTYHEMGRKKEGDALLMEDLERHMAARFGERSIGVWSGMGGVYYYIGVDHLCLGNDEKAVRYLDSALQKGFGNVATMTLIPAVSSIREREDFKLIVKKINDYREFNKVAFTRAFKNWQGSEDLAAVLK